MPAVEVSRDCETGSDAGVADEVEDFGITVKRFRGPVFRNLGEQAVLDGIPFGSAGGVMSNGDGEPKTVAEVALKFGFPGAGSATVAATSIGQDEPLPTAMVAIRAVALPPAGDGVRGESGGGVRDPHTDRASIGQPVLDAVRDRDADGIGPEIGIRDAHGRAIPFDAIVFESADQVSFFGIDAEDGKSLVLEAGT